MKATIAIDDELFARAQEYASDKETSAVKDLVRAEMCGAYALNPPLAVDIGVGENWAEAKS